MECVFTCVGLVTATDVGLLGYLFHQYDGQGWFAAGDGSDTSRVRSIMTLVLVTAVWTTLFAFTATISVKLCDIGCFVTGVVPLWIISIILWAVSTGMFHGIRDGGDCQGRISLCHQLKVVEALGWTAFVLLTLLMTAFVNTDSAPPRVRRRRTRRTNGV